MTIIFTFYFHRVVFDALSAAYIQYVPSLTI